MTPTPSQPKIHIERMMYRNSIAVSGDTAASYALIKLIPAGGGGKSLPLNLALVLDVSGSMYEEDGTGTSRLTRVQEAAHSAIQKLKPEDHLSIVAFAHDCQVVLPATSLSEKAKIEEVISRIDRFDVDPGGTAMDQGIEMGLAEIRKHHGPGKLSQMMVLTDGETSGEPTCKQLARTAAAEKIRINVIGVGTDWNQNLIKELAKLAEGDWGYIDVNDASAATRLFADQFETMAAAGFLNVEMRLKAMKDIKIKRVRQVVPDIKELPLTEPEDRLHVSSLGTLERDNSTRYVLDLSLPKRPDGKFVIAQIEVTYDTGRGGARESTGMVPLEVSYTSSGNGYINAEVAKHIDEVQIFEANKNLQSAIAGNDMTKARQAAEIIEKKAEVMGPRAAKKTMLAKQVLQELNVGGRVSKKTQLAVDDVARMVEETPVS
jgi:Ca-activated chloride channel family protein